MGHFERKFQTLTTVDCPFVWYQNISSALFGLVTKHACDRQTDEQAGRITTSKTVLASKNANFDVFPLITSQP